MQTLVQLLPHTECGLFNTMVEDYEYVCIYNDAPIFFKDMDEASSFSKELEAKLIAEGKEMPCLLFCSID